MVSFQKVWPWNKVKGFDVFSVIRLKGEVDFLVESVWKSFILAMS